VTPIFFTVKYAGVEDICRLIDAGADCLHRDFNGKTCLYNAIEFPTSTIIEELMKHLPATEGFSLFLIEDGKTMACTMTAADLVLKTFLDTDCIDESTML
jgi:hypothetical protein